MQQSFSLLIIRHLDLRPTSKSRTDLRRDFVQKTAIVELPFRDRKMLAIQRAQRVEPQRIMMNVAFPRMRPFTMVINKDPLAFMLEQEIAFEIRVRSAHCFATEGFVQPLRQRHLAIQLRHPQSIAASSQRRTQQQSGRAFHGGPAAIRNKRDGRGGTLASVKARIVLRERLQPFTARQLIALGKPA